ncbi:D-alanyl-D-alanine carboxypeptidase family protein [Hyphomicrobium sp. CS1BSMeth3]|jgi:D-alanyl-D-alanine carboxypeptidase|uniref:D-alanyl-D-alanine carboxypeptidase family protein n=1 Tax=Hyphomicrobium sp. CS1BSMeth3 TaxID=1892844 RepID=UPI0009FB1858|nr:D-alanyl-D-alanine carboxypeptidase family protein [Hyphomicrobium sp. CS1BSMeth3]
MVVRKTAIALALMLGWMGSAAAGPALLFDAANGRVLYAEEQDQPWHPASLTKIMTAYLVFEALKTNTITLEQKIPVSANAHAQPPSKLGLPVGAEITVNLALKALIVKSANDAAVMLAEAIGGSEEAFVRSMNATALRLGMTQTRFVNPHGLPAPEQVTTARDLARLTRAVLTDYSDRSELWTMPDMQIGRRRLRTHNGLLRTYEGADGLKTGFICDSGFNVVATATRDNRRLAAVVLGEYTSRDRSLRAASLLEHGFRNYGWKELFSNATVDSVPVSAETSTPRSVRELVMSFACNGKRQARAVPTKGQKKARAKKRATAKADAAKRPEAGSASETAAAKSN